MSDQNINIRIYAEAEETRRTLHEVDERLVKLREGATLTGKQFTQQMQLAAQSTQRLNDNIQRAGAAQARYRKRINELQQSMARIREQYDLGNISLSTKRMRLLQVGKAQKQYEQRLKQSQVEQQKYQAQLKTVEQNTRSLTASKQKLSKSSGDLGSAFGRLRGVANQLAGVFGVGLGLYGLARLFMSAGKTVAAFDQKMRGLEAITNASSREMERMSNIAIKVGGASKYGAEGVGELMRQLAKLGFTINEIDDMTNSIVRLATAAGEDLEQAAETTAVTIRGFQMTAEDTTEVVDNMAVSFTRSALDLQAYRESMKYIAPVAKTANFALDDTVAMLMQLADAGIKGSLAGTSLRRIMLRLSDSSSDLATRIGYNVGGFDDFVESLQKMNEAGYDLEDTLNMIDVRSVTVMQRLMENSDALLDTRESMRSLSGVAEQMANVRMQGLEYQIEMAGQAWNSMILSLEKGDGTISRIIRTSLGGFTNIMHRITEAHSKQSKETENSLALLQTLHSRVTNLNISKERRLQAIQDLRAEFPGYFDDLKEEAILTGEAEDAHDDLKDAMEREVEYQSAEEAMEKEARRMKSAGEQIDWLEFQMQKLEDGTLTVADGWELLFKGVSESQGAFDRYNRTAIKTVETLKAMGFALPELMVKFVEMAFDVDLGVETGKQAIKKGLEDLIAHIKTSKDKYNEAMRDWEDIFHERAKEIPITDLIEDEYFDEEIAAMTEKYKQGLDDMVEAKMEANEDLKEPIAYEEAADEIIKGIKEEIKWKERRLELAEEETQRMQDRIDIIEEGGSANIEEYERERKHLEGLERQIDNLNELKAEGDERAADILEKAKKQRDQLEASVKVTKKQIEGEQTLVENMDEVLDRKDKAKQEEREIIKEIEFRKQVEYAILEALEAQEQDRKSELADTRETLRLEQRIKEAVLKRKYEGAVLDEKLIKNEAKYGRLIANTMEGRQRILNLRLTDKEEMLAEQQLEAEGIRRNLGLEEDAHDRKMAAIEREIELREKQIKGEGEGREALLNQELNALEYRFEREKEARREALDMAKKARYEEIEAIKKEYPEATDERRRKIEEVNAEYKEAAQELRSEELEEIRDFAEKSADIELEIQRYKLSEMERQHNQAMDRMEHEHAVELYDVENVDSMWKAMDLLGWHTRKVKETERTLEQERLQRHQEWLQNHKERLEGLIKELKIQQEKAKEEGEGAEAARLGVEIHEMEQELHSLDTQIDETVLSLKQLEEAPTTEYWQDFVNNMRDIGNQLTGIYQGVLDEQYRIAREERSIHDRRISEMQRSLDTELRLREQGFASNVEARKAALEKEKQLREQALRREREAAERKRRVEQMLQWMNLATSITELFKSEISTKGMFGIATGAAAAAALMGAYSSFKAEADTATQTYEHGGSFMLDGASHSQGGVPIAPGHEGQGGEMVSVFSRPATRKYKNEIKSVTDMFNSGNVPDQGDVHFDTSEITRIRQLLEQQEQTTYTNTHKITKTGNITRKCRIN